MNSDTFLDLLAKLRAYCDEVAAGEVPLDLTITFVSGRHLSHPIPRPREQARPPRPAHSHSPDFRTVHWFGTDYTFTPTQAACVRVLWEAWEDGGGEVGVAAILEAAGSESSRLPPLFQGSPAWGTLIVPGGGKGTYRLAAGERG